MDEKNTEFPLINILIRTSNRPNGFRKCLTSIVSQSYSNIRIIVSYDNDLALNYVPKGLETIRVYKEDGYEFPYDRYCNILKNMVHDGYFFLLDDDNQLVNDILKELPLTGPGLIVQCKIGNHIFPNDLNFKPGLIGMPCMILHHSLKNIADISGHSRGDSHWIRNTLSKIDLPFVPIVTVFGYVKGHGICNG